MTEQAKTTEAPTAETTEATAATPETDQSGQSAQATGDQVPGSEPLGEPGGATKEDPELSRRQKQRERRREQQAMLAREREQLKTELARLKALAEPKAEDFEDDYEFGVARAVYRQQQATAEAQSKPLTERAEALDNHAKKLQAQEIEEKFADFRAKAADFDDRLKAVAAHPHAQLVSPQVVQIVNADPELLYYIGNNTDKVTALASADGDEALLMLGEMRAAIRAQGDAVAKQPAPPPPIDPVGGGAQQTDPSKMTSAQYEQWMRDGGLI